MKRNIGQEILDSIEAIKDGGIPAAILNPELESNTGGVYLRGIC